MQGEEEFTYDTNMVPHTTKERSNIVGGIWKDKLTVVENQTDP